MKIICKYKIDWFYRHCSLQSSYSSIIITIMIIVIIGSSESSGTRKDIVDIFLLKWQKN